MRRPGLISRHGGAAAAAASYADAVLGYSPDFYLSMQETAGSTLEDATANNRDGTIVSTGVTLGQPGLLTEAGDKAIVMDGTADGRISHSYATFSNSIRRLLVGWARVTDVTAPAALTGNSGGDGALRVLAGTDDFRVSRFGWWDLTWADCFPVNTTIMWAIDADAPGETMELYINGVSEGSKAWTIAGGQWGGSNLLLGWDSGTGFFGKQSHVAGFTGVTNPAAVVADLYAVGTA